MTCDSCPRAPDLNNVSCPRAPDISCPRAPECEYQKNIIESSENRVSDHYCSGQPFAITMTPSLWSKKSIQAQLLSNPLCLPLPCKPQCFSQISLTAGTMSSEGLSRRTQGRALVSTVDLRDGWLLRASHKDQATSHHHPSLCHRSCRLVADGHNL